MGGLKLSEVIKGLQDVLDEEGDLECFYAIDDEGNAFNPVYSHACDACPEEYGIDSDAKKVCIIN
jgi:hypothetical protein